MLHQPFGEQRFLFVKRMINFKISAPGNLILCGEHMTMYGGHVVIASLDLRTNLRFYELDDSSNIIKIEFPHVNLSFNLSLELVLNFFSGNAYNNLVENTIKLLKHVQYFITSNGMWTTYEQKYSLQTLIFLLIYIAHHERINITSFHVHLTTPLPIKADLGSSTSFAVCLAACFVHWKRLQRGRAHRKFSKEELKRISQYANSCEKVIKNYMFEKYSEVCTYGQIYRYRYNIKHGNKFFNVPRIKILLIDSGIRLNKYQQMEKMADIINSSASSANAILKKMDSISMRASNKLAKIPMQRNKFSRKFRRIYLSLNICIQTNQVLLCELGLSHPNLNKICTIAKTNGLAGKLTGLGGYAYILFIPGTSNGYIMHIAEKLMAEGFTVTKTCVSCNGVTIDN